MKTQIIIAILVSYMATSCQFYDSGLDYQIFDNTPVEKLARAVQNDNIEKIIYLVKDEKIDINYQEKEFGNTILSLAAVNQNAATVEALLKLGANPNIFGGQNNDTPFLDAINYTYPARTCDISKIKILIKYGADVNTICYDTLPSPRGVSNNQINTALMLASKNGCIETVKLLVENGADINKYPQEYGHGAITEALIQDNIEIAKYLIVNARANIPDYVFIREANINYIGEPEQRLTITDMLLEDDYRNEASKQKAKEEILSYLNKIGKK